MKIYINLSCVAISKLNQAPLPLPPPIPELIRQKYPNRNSIKL